VIHTITIGYSTIKELKMQIYSIIIKKGK